MAAWPDETVLKGVAATIHVTFVDQNGDPADAGGSVTVDIATASGTVVATARSTTNPTGTGTYIAALTATECANLDLLTCTWKDATVARAMTKVEIAGGTYWGLAALKEQEPSIRNSSRTEAQIRSALREAIEECERCCGVAFVPRYGYETVCVASDGTVVLETPLPRSVRSAVDVDGNAVDFADVELYETGKIARLGGSGYLTVGWEHGADRPPEPVRAMVARRTRYRLGLTSSPDQDRQARFVVQDGATLTFASASAWRTGDDEVDSVYSRFGLRVPGVA